MTAQGRREDASITDARATDAHSAARASIGGRVLRGLLGPLPSWAQASHPMLRYQRGQAPTVAPFPMRLLRAFMIEMAGLGLLLIGLIIATGLTHAPGTNWVESAHYILYFPLVGLQLVARIAALGLTTPTINDEVRRQNWDNVRATERGAELLLRARWASIFYRLRGLLGVILVLRVGLILLLLWDLTAFQGHYIDLLLNGITPETSITLGILLLAALMTAGVLLPLTGVGLDAALGLLISAHFSTRTHSARSNISIAQGLLILVRVTLVIGLLLGATRFLEGSLTPPDAAAWLLLFAAAALGDWGLALLYLARAGEVWTTLPYGILIGPALLAFALVQAVATDWLLSAAARRAQARG